MNGHYFIDLGLTTGNSTGLTMSNAFRYLEDFFTIKDTVSNDGKIYIWIRARNININLSEYFLEIFSQIDKPCVYSIWGYPEIDQFINCFTIENTPLIKCNYLNLSNFNRVETKIVNKKILMNNGDILNVLGLCSCATGQILNQFIFNQNKIGKVVKIKFKISESEYKTEYGILYHIEEHIGNYHKLYIFIPNYYSLVNYTNNFHCEIISVNENDFSENSTEGFAYCDNYPIYDGSLIVNKIYNNTAYTNFKFLSHKYYELCQSLTTEDGADLKDQWNNDYSSIDSQCNVSIYSDLNSYANLYIDENIELVNFQYFKNTGFYPPHDYPIVLYGNAKFTNCTLVSTYNPLFINNNTVKIIDSLLSGSYDEEYVRGSCFVNKGNIYIENSIIGYGYSSVNEYPLEPKAFKNYGNLYLKNSEFKIITRSTNDIDNFGTIYILNSYHKNLQDINNKLNPFNNSVACVRFENCNLDNLINFTDGIISKFCNVETVKNPTIKYKNETYNYKIKFLDFEEYNYLNIYEKIFHLQEGIYNIEYYAKLDDLSNTETNPFKFEVESINTLLTYNNFTEYLANITKDWTKFYLQILLTFEQNIRLKIKLNNISYNENEIIYLCPIPFIEKVETNYE